MLCERCSDTIFKNEVCKSCKRKICFNCVKSSRRVSKTMRIVICRDCWSKMPARQTFKSMNVATV